MKFNELEGLTKGHKKTLLDLFANVYRVKGKESNSITILSKEYVPCRNRTIQCCYKTALFRFAYGSKGSLVCIDLCESCVNEKLNSVMEMYIKTFSNAKNILEDKYRDSISYDLMKSECIEEPLRDRDSFDSVDLGTITRGQTAIENNITNDEFGDHMARLLRNIREGSIGD